MNKYDFKSSASSEKAKKKNSKYSFKPSKESENVIAKNNDSTLVKNVNNIMRFNKER